MNKDRAESNQKYHEDKLLDVGPRVKSLRNHHRLSIRQLSKISGVAYSYISAIESGRSSPTITTLRKLLTAMNTDVHTFFALEASHAEQRFVFRNTDMKHMHLAHSDVKLVLPMSKGILLQMDDEHIQPHEIPPFYSMPANQIGYLLEGGDFILEVKGRDLEVLHPGDGFYVPERTPVRGYCAGNEPARLIVAYDTAWFFEGDSVEVEEDQTAARQSNSRLAQKS